MRYTELFDYWLLPLLSYLLPAPCSLKPRYLYLTSRRIAINVLIV
ncbi:hypothetical protein [Moorena sp. SIO3I6]|nr:hypothetical protein [Moorena sp. SIO3I6]